MDPMAQFIDFIHVRDSSISVHIAYNYTHI